MKRSWKYRKYQKSSFLMLFVFLVVGYGLIGCSSQPSDELKSHANAEGKTQVQTQRDNRIDAGVEAPENDATKATRSETAQASTNQTIELPQPLPRVD